MAKLALTVALVFTATYVSATTSFGIAPNDYGRDAPYLQSLTPPMGPKQGGTPITIQGAGFVDDQRLACRFTRLDPQTEHVTTKSSTATYVSQTEITCESPAWDEGPCASCASTTPLSGNFYGHTGSPYLRSDSTNVPNEIGIGDYIYLPAAAKTPAAYAQATPAGGILAGGQYFEVTKVEACSAAAGCVCGVQHAGAWGPATPATSAKGYNSTGHAHFTVTDTNCDLYRYDRLNEYGVKCNTADGNPICSNDWKAGTKITLAEPVYRIDGYPNVKFGVSPKVAAHRASKFSCSGCKCGDGCPVTVSVTTDGSVYSGAGVGGKTWTGSALSFTVKDIVPTVQYITNGLAKRDSTRIAGPATGGTVITVVGTNFQNSPQLRCFFAQNKILSQAQWISDKMVTCKTPPFFSFLNDDGTTKANYDGSAMNPHTKVHVTNDGMINDDVEGSRISQNPHKQDDDSYSYIHGPLAQRWQESFHGTLLNSVKTTLTDIDPATPGTGNTAYTAAASGTACTGAGELTTGSTTYTTAADAMVACNNMVHCHGISQNGASGNFKLCNAAATWVANAAMTCSYVHDATGGKKCTGAGQYGSATFATRALAEAACNIDAACHGISQNGVSSAAAFTLCNAASTWVTDATMTCSTAVNHKCIHQRTETTTTYSGASLANKCVWQRSVPTSVQTWYEPLDTYVDGYSPHNPFRSTCIEGKYQNFQEKMGPCYNAGLAGNSEGNDVLFKYATCYESQKAGEYKDGVTPEPSFNLYGNGATDLSSTLAAHYYIVQRFKIDKSKNLEGPLSHIQIHLEKPTSEVAELEVNITANGQSTPAVWGTAQAANAASGGTVLASVKIHVHRIANSFAASPHADSQNRYFNVFFPTAPYLMPDRYYDFTIRHISGAQDVRFNYTTGASAGHTAYQNSSTPVAVNYNIRGFTCDGCRERMTFNPSLASPYSNIKFGEIPTSIRTDATTDANAGTTVGNAAITGSWFSSVLQPTTTAGIAANPMHAYDQPSGGYRTMVAQAFRPKETGTLTHVKLRIKTSKIYHGNVNEYKAKISIWVTEHGKYGEYVCNAFGGSQTGNMCDGSAVTNDLTQSPSGYTGSTTGGSSGTFNQPCGLGTVCNPYNGLNGGCGDRGVCSLATTVTNAHRLRPESGDPAQGPCSYDAKCSDTMSLNPDHEKVLGQVDNLAASSWTVFEFKLPVPVTKHTTYYLNSAVVGDAMESGEVIWYAAKGADQNTPVAAPFNPYGVAHVAAPDELYNGGNYGAFVRDATTWNWALAAPTGLPTTRVSMAISFIRCVTAHSNVMGFATTGEKTGCCSARASRQGGDKGAKVTVTGRNFFPSDHLRCVFRNEDGTGGMMTQATVTKGDYTEATCPAPTHSPHTGRDCSNPALCQGVELVMTHDGLNVGPQYMGPKWTNACPTTLGSACTQTAATTALPAYSGQNPLKFLFSEIYVAVTGSDTTGDGTYARPYGTIQRGLDAANENDQLLLLTGTYVGLGNRGLRHHGKKIQLKAYSGEHTVAIDCQHAPDGFILNNNKDSDSPFAGYVDTQGVITRNCENLRIYDI